MPIKKDVKRIDTPYPTPLTPEARENMLISLAMDRAEEQLRDGTASAQVIVHYLRLGCRRDKLEQTQLEKKNELLKAKTDAIKAAENTERLYAEAMKAFRYYGGEGDDEDQDYETEDGEIYE